MLINNRLRTEQIGGPNRSCAQAGSDMSSGGSGTTVTPACRRAAIQTDIDFRDIRTCRRVLLVRARFKRSIGSSADNIYGEIEHGRREDDGDNLPRKERPRGVTACSRAGLEPCD